jgi:hypothetical protein
MGILNIMSSGKAPMNGFPRNLFDDDFRGRVLSGAPPELISNSIANAVQNPMSLTQLAKVNPAVNDMIQGNVNNFYQNNMIGGISSKYESGGKTNIISSGKGDPGGISYGPYQLASKTGTLSKFVNNSPYAEQLAGLKPGTTQFNSKWKELSEDPAFIESQHNFISQNNYQPVKSYAQQLGLPDNKALNEALWSMGVQHGGANKILNKAVKTFNGDINNDVGGFLQHLYNTRGQYVRGVSALGSGMKASLLNRYKNELSDVMNLYNATLGDRGNIGKMQ